jgi:transmembrane sensor
MREDVDWERLAAYLAGECGPDERSAIERWMAEHPDHRALVDRAREVWARTGALAPPGDATVVDAAWGRMAARLGAPAPRRAVAARRTAPPAELRARSGGRGWLRAALRIAAVLVVGIGGGLLWRAAPWHGSAASARVAMREFSAERGERAIVRLSDSTRIVLAAESRLWVPSDFGVHARSVRLEGEAYFEVAHDPAKPFVVHAARAVTQVLGTQFSVRAYPGDERVDVVVRSGRVALRAAGAPPAAGTVLTRGDAGRLDTAGTMTVARHVDVDAALAWTTGRLAFDKIPFRDVAREIERWYGLSIQLADTALADRRVTASFADESSDEVLDALALLVNARVERHGAVATFRAKPSHP